MDPSFWHRKWEENQIGFHNNEANPLLVNYFDKLSLVRGQRIFVPLCGKTLDISWLLSKGYQVVAIELSETAIEQLFAEMDVVPDITQEGELKHYHAQGLDIYVGDFFTLTHDILGRVDAIYDRAALVALPENMRVKYTHHLMTMTNHAAQLLISYTYDQSKTDGPPFSISTDEVQSHYASSYAITLVARVDVPGGMRGKSAATENVWILKPHI